MYPLLDFLTGFGFHVMFFFLIENMVRTYKRKTNRSKADGGLMKRAVEEVVKGRSVRQVARDLQIDRITLSRYVFKFHAGQTGNTSDFAPNYNSRQVEYITVLCYYLRQSLTEDHPPHLSHSSFLAPPTLVTD